MATMTLTIDEDELRGLRAVVAIAHTAEGISTDSWTKDQTDAATIKTAKLLMDTALAGKLRDVGLPWAPSADAKGKDGASTGGHVSKVLRRGIPIVLAVGLLVILWGGYSEGWQWTGFQANGQLWDWLDLLLLPVLIGALPLWLQYNRYIGSGRRTTYAAVGTGWIVFVIVGYLIPLAWTGFTGQTLWTWLQLLVLPAAVAVTVALTSMHVLPATILRSLSPYLKAILAALAVGWLVTVIGGYALGWAWTGYSGNTLWDWCQLLLLPLLLPTVLLPMLLKWITGNAAGHASHQAVVHAAASENPSVAVEKVDAQ